MRFLVAGLALLWSSGGVFAAERVPQPLPRPLPHGAQVVPDVAKRSTCRVALAAIAAFKPLPPLENKGACGIVDPVSLDAVILPSGARAVIDPPARLRCDMAQAVARWLRDDVVDELAPLGELRGIENYDSYSCRPRNRVAGAKISEHARGNALDIRAVKLAGGVTDRLTDASLDQKVRAALRESACKRFHTVLGPGSDGYHEGHIHLDLAPRHNDYRICQWALRTPDTGRRRSAHRGSGRASAPRASVTRSADRRQAERGR